MPIYNIKVTGWESIEAADEETALNWFEQMYLDHDYLLRDLRSKVVEVDDDESKDD